MKDFLQVGLVLAVLALVVLSPLLVVWALNTLFGLSIAYSFWTWLAALILIVVVKPNVSVKARR